MDTYFSSFFKSITSGSMGCGHPDKVADAISDAKHCEVQVSYSIGKAEPVSVEG